MSTKGLTIFLRDRNETVVAAWERCFKDEPRVRVSCGEIFEATADAVVSPANSFGFMDGGIDLVYSQHFGWDLQHRLQEILRRDHDGELPVGQAVVVKTHHSEVPWLVSAPTMRIPMDVSETVNAYLAFRAVIRAVGRHNASTLEPIRSILCPGLGTAIGGMSAERCAWQMYVAYRVVVLGQALESKTLGQAVDAHYKLLK